MKKLISIILALVLLFSLASAASAETKLEKILAEGKIIFATSPDFAPSEFIDPNKEGDEKYVGADVELAKYIAQKLGVELVIQPMDFGALQAAVTQGAVDIAISGFAKTEERAENMNLSDFYNTERDEDNGQRLLVKAGEGANYPTAESFSGKTVAAQIASLQYNLITAQLPEDIKIKTYSNINESILALINGRVDAVAVAGTNGLMIINANGEDKIEFADFWLDYSSDGNVIAMTKGEDDLTAAVNEILAEVNELGLYKGWKDEAQALAESLGIETH